MTLRELLTHRKSTQAELARRLGVSQAMVSKWVSGARNPKWQTAAKIAGALDAVVTVNPPHKGSNWNYTPVGNSPARQKTQEEINGEMSYLDEL